MLSHSIKGDSKNFPIFVPVESIFNSRYIWLLILTIAALTACNSSSQPESELPLDSVIVDLPPSVEYGLLVDSFQVFEGRVGRNEFLADILGRHNVPYKDIHQLSILSEGVFNLRKMRRGNPYKLFSKKDSSSTLQCMVYEISKADYVVFDFRDSINVYRGQKPIRTEVKTSSGVIEHSLYVTMQENDINILVALELSDVYAWQIDFFRLQKGDKFRVIYEEQFIESISVGVRRILAASFEHGSKNFYGIWFNQDEPDYFDEEGNSLRKQFLKAPLKFSRISSGYSGRRFHPVLKRYRSHLGVDYAAPRGTPIRATGDGTIVESGYKSGNGKYIKIKHNSAYTTGYLHMSRKAPGMKRGVRVNQGQVIGYVGSTGLASGPHLCFRFWKNGHQVNPLTIDVPPSKPVSEDYRLEFNLHRDSVVRLLDQISFPQLSI